MYFCCQRAIERDRNFETNFGVFCLSLYDKTILRGFLHMRRMLMHLEEYLQYVFLSPTGYRLELFSPEVNIIQRNRNIETNFAVFFICHSIVRQFYAHWTESFSPEFNITQQNRNLETNFEVF